MRQFSILDLLAITAVVALHLAALPAEAATGGSDLAALLYFTPTAFTCLLHLRLRLTITSAIVVHYVASAAWTFLHAVGLNFAINAHNLQDPDPRRDYQIEIYSNAWNDTVAMLGWGIAFAAVYGVICYTAVTASAGRDTTPDVLESQGEG
ncbi:hypothetical protein [Aporhodopirellula aestuarii]|uniref:Uncharacterized protein n=1 Tax=Aporhodopirellula aestuarii TaxID=2950107 RepID=A0ABT0UCG3_9BACT|nr:hypothetical protein [Aporhodopirellula aestuarii]MCM2374719.1 hypothetical protein [Aporhodopirellula aestuarii]